MKFIKAIILLLLLSLSQAGFAEKDKLDFVKDHPIKKEEYSKFGMIQITNDGSVVLNDKVLLRGNFEKDDFDTTIDYSIAGAQYDKTSPWKDVQAYGEKIKHQSVLRLVLVGRSQNPVYYRILDLTGKEPYISEKFGKNEYHWTNEFASAEWGKNKSYINLVGGIMYLYTTYKDVQGPFAY
ncbi:hypothetical protein [Collimonas pratensis]|uniref:Uncharacterized protein n=1 Tax=Collimonas pratensis TaxID=279113 RepID=A0A127Q6U3_9BURK|nr:hypothetical protein [Collimonas pratensis]AMP05790.1 hypothetical protein CPter91_3464 [Collimonas pratensis]